MITHRPKKQTNQKYMITHRPKKQTFVILKRSELCRSREIHHNSITCLLCYFFQLQDFIEGEFLTEQVDSIKQLADFVTILTRTQSNPVGWHIFDEELYEGKR